MKKKTLLAIAASAKKYGEIYAKDRRKDSPLSYSSWMTYYESSIRNTKFYVKTDALIDNYRAEDEEEAVNDRPDAVVLGDERYKEFPEMNKLRSARDKKDKLWKERQTLLDNAAKRAEAEKKRKKTKVDVIEEEFEEDEGPVSPEEQKRREFLKQQKANALKKEAEEKAQIQKEEDRLKEIALELDTVENESLSLSKKLDAFLSEQEKNNLVENREKAKEDIEYNNNAAELADAQAFADRIGLLCAAKDILGKRTWKDYLFHPFRSIGEYFHFKDMKNTFLYEYEMTETQLDAVITTVGDGDSRRLANVDSIDEHGFVVERLEAIEDEEPKIEINAKENEKVNLEAEFAPEKNENAEPMKTVEKTVVEDPHLGAPNHNN